jgi:ribonuclease HII
MKDTSKTYPNTDYEAPFWASGNYVAGVDEAGRGCLAGPVVAAAVILPRNFTEKTGINDSKKLLPSRRFELYNYLIKNVLDFRVELIDSETVDRINILQATLLAMRNASFSLRPRPSHLLIDGNRFNECIIPYSTIVDGDALCLSIAAASILAKVLRDIWMTEIADKIYPNYGFAQHKGYGTKQHYEAIKKHGITPIHRKTFLKKIEVEQCELFE